MPTLHQNLTSDSIGNKKSQDYFLFLITVFVALCASLCLWHFSWVWSVQHDARNIDLCICFETRWEWGFAMIFRSWYKQKIHNMQLEYNKERNVALLQNAGHIILPICNILQLAALKELLQYLYIPIKELLRLKPNILSVTIIIYLFSVSIYNTNFKCYFLFE